MLSSFTLSLSSPYRSESRERHLLGDLVEDHFNGHIEIEILIVAVHHSTDL
jgi:hypothetical protein